MGPNRSSVKNSVVGRGLTRSILENVKNLSERHVQHNNDRLKKSNELYVTSQS